MLLEIVEILQSVSAHFSYHRVDLIPRQALWKKVHSIHNLEEVFCSDHRVIAYLLLAPGVGQRCVEYFANCGIGYL